MSCCIHAVCKDCYAGLVDVGMAVVQPNELPTPPRLGNNDMPQEIAYATCCHCGLVPPAFWWYGERDVFKPHGSPRHNARQDEAVAAVFNAGGEVQDPLMEAYVPPHRTPSLVPPVIPS